MKAVWKTGDICSMVHNWAASDGGYYVPTCSTRSIPQVPLQELSESSESLEGQRECPQCFPQGKTRD